MKRGKPRLYSDLAVLTMAIVEEVYHLTIRATEGFFRSIFELIKLDLPVCDYTTLCRRRKRLDVEIPKKKAKGPLHLVVDSSGVKVYGEGEWKALLYGRAKHRRWIKVHIGVDERTGEILAAVVTGNDSADSEVFPDLIEQVEGKIGKVIADKAYDKGKCYEVIERIGAKAVIPPRKGAKIWKHGNCKGERHIRDENLIRKYGKRKWKEESGYYRRSKAEVTFFRKKIIFSDRVSARSFDGRAVQNLIRLAALNRMSQLGMPDSYAV